MGNPYKIKHHTRIYRRSPGSMILRGLVVLFGALLLFGAGWGLYGTVTGMLQNRPQAPSSSEPSPETDLVPGESSAESTSEPSETADPAVEQPAAPVSTQLEAAWLSASTITDPQQFSAALDAAAQKGQNAVVVPLKESGGQVNYPITYQDASDQKSRAAVTFDLEQTASQITQAGLTPVASISAFRDALYPSADNTAATRYRGSDYLWLDNDPAEGGKLWMNPFADSSVAYLKKLISDAAQAGFTQVILSDFQFPEGYSLDMIDYGDHDSDDKNAYLASLLVQLKDYAQEQGVQLCCLLPASSLLGGSTDPWFGSPSVLAGEQLVVDLRASVFGSGLQNDLVNIADPSADLANTVRTAGAALVQQLPDTQLTAVISGSTPEEIDAQVQALEELGIAYILVS